MGKIYMKCLYKQVAKEAFENGVLARNPVHLLCFIQSFYRAWVVFQPGILEDGSFQAADRDAFFRILNFLRELEAQKLGYASEAARLYAAAQGKAPKIGETVSIYV